MSPAVEQVTQEIRERIGHLTASASAQARQDLVRHLVKAVASLDGQPTQEEILSSLLAAGLGFASRTAFFLTRAEGLRCWASEGFGPAASALRGLQLDYRGEPWTTLAAGCGPVAVSAAEGQALADRVAAGASQGGVLVPFILRGQLGGALYADRTDDGPPVMVEGLQLLVHAAAQAFETLAFRNLPAVSPTLRSLGEDGVGASLWQAVATAAPRPAPAPVLPAMPAAVQEETSVQARVQDRVQEETAATPPPASAPFAASLAAEAPPPAASLDDTADVGLGQTADEATAEVASPITPAPPATFLVEEAGPGTGEAGGEWTAPAVESAVAESAVAESAVAASHESDDQSYELIEPPTLELADELPFAEIDTFESVVSAAAPEPVFVPEESGLEFDAMPLEEPVLAAEPDLDETASVLWDLEEAPPEEAASPTATASLELRTGPVATIPTATPAPPFPAAPPLEDAIGQQTVRLDVSALQSSLVREPEEPTARSFVQEATEDPTLMVPRSALRPSPPPSPPPVVAPPVVAPPEAPAAAASAPPLGETAAPSISTEVKPPADVRGPGSAFVSAAHHVVISDGEQALHEEARRLARLLVSEIKLYNEEVIEAGRRDGNIYERLKDDIDRSRQMYDDRIDPRIRERDYFYQELVQRLAGGNPNLLGM